MNKIASTYKGLLESVESYNLCIYVALKCVLIFTIMMSVSFLLNFFQRRTQKTLFTLLFTFTQTQSLYKELVSNVKEQDDRPVI